MLKIPQLSTQEIKHSIQFKVKAFYKQFLQMAYIYLANSQLLQMKLF